MKGKDYRARVRLSTKDNVTLAEVGETCERVPKDALEWLLRSRKIEAVAAVAVPVMAPTEPEPDA